MLIALTESMDASITEKPVLTRMTERLQMLALQKRPVKSVQLI